MTVMIYHGDCLNVLRQMPDESVNCVVTSPPYYGLRDYGVAGQMGLEETPQQFVAAMVEVFREIRRVLTKDGTCWVNMGDSYATRGGGGAQGETGQMADRTVALHRGKNIPRGSGRWGGGNMPAVGNIKPKDLMGMPWRLALALHDDGWWLRQDIIWSKPNPMPESVTDRCTKSHEYIFLLTKSAKYFFDNDAIREPFEQDEMANGFRGGSYVHDEAQNNTQGSPRKKKGNMKLASGWATGEGKHRTIRSENTGVGFGHGTDKEKRARTRVKGGVSAPGYDEKKWETRTEGLTRPPMTMKDREYHPLGRNKRSVWEVATAPCREAHFATFPPKLIEPCILAGCPKGGIVLDPFFGAGTTGLVAHRNQRSCIGIELNADYVEIAMNRLLEDAGMFCELTIVKG